MMKKYIKIGVGIILVAGLSGCGGGILGIPIIPIL